jgi:hypothetical protein
MLDDEKNNEERNEPVGNSIISSLPVVTLREQRLGVQVGLGGLVKSKLEEEAAAVLKRRGETFLEEIVLEGQRIAILDQPKVFDAKVSPQNITQAFNRTVNRAAQRGAERSRFSKFVHEAPVLLFAVGLTKFVDGLRAIAQKGDVPTDMTIACVSLVLALVMTFFLSQHD